MEKCVHRRSSSKTVKESRLCILVHRRIKRDLTEDMKANFHEHPILFLFLNRGLGLVCNDVKGSVTRDFRLQIFHNSASPGPLSIPLGSFQIFQIFPEKIANEGLSAVSTTPAKKDKFEIKFFLNILLRA